MEYDPNRVANLVPTEFSDLVGKSILSSNMDGILGELRSEIDDQLGGDGR